MGPGHASNMSSLLLEQLSAVYHANLPVSIGLTLAIVAIIGGVIFWQGYPKPLKDIPYNKDAAKQWLGDVPSFKKHFDATGEGWDWMAMQCEKLNSPIVQVFLGPYQKPTIILVDHVEIRDMITRRAKEFDRGGFLTKWFSSAIPHGTISMPTHDRFKAQRAAWQGTMTTDFVVRTFVPHMRRHTLDLVERWRVKAECANGKPFEANADIRVNIFEIVWSAAFGNDLGLTGKQGSDFLRASGEQLDDETRFPRIQDEGILEAVAYILNTLDTTRSTPFPTLHHAILRQKPSYRRYNKIKQTTIQELLASSKAKFESSRKGDNQVTCAMDYVYKRQIEKADKFAAASDAEMEDELMVFLVGGFESSQHNTSWGLKYLAQSPTVQAKLHHELSSTFLGANADHLPSAREVATANLPYLDAVLEELLRLSRTNAGALRITTRDTQLYNFFIPKGTDVFGVHSGESAVISLPPRPAGWSRTVSESNKKGSWDRASLSSFMPERWLTRSSKDGSLVFDSSAGPSMAFGAGPRGCFGQSLARMTLRMLFTLLVLSFEFEPIQGEKASFAAEEKLVRMAKHCYVKIKVRQ